MNENMAISPPPTVKTLCFYAPTWGFARSFILLCTCPASHFSATPHIPGLFPRARAPWSASPLLRSPRPAPTPIEEERGALPACVPVGTLTDHVTEGVRELAFARELLKRAGQVAQASLLFSFFITWYASKCLKADGERGTGSSRQTTVQGKEKAESTGGGALWAPQ